MTITEIRDRVAAIRRFAWDDEKAHSEEDSLWAAVLHDIADGGEQAAAKAKAALATEQIEFARWCA